MAIRFAFVRPQADPLPSGPYREVTFMRDELIADGEVPAKYIEHRWQVRGVDARFSSVEFGGPIDVYFERKDAQRSKACGPYDTFRLMDGIAYAGGHVFAFFDIERQDWYSSALGQHWLKMTICAAAE